MCIRNSGHPKDQRKTKSQQVLLQNPSYLRFLQPLPKKEFFIVNNGFKREKGQLLVTVKDYFLFFLTFINEQKKRVLHSKDCI